MQIGYLLRLGLQGRPCVVFGPDGKVRIEVTDRSTYPDVSVVCGSVQRATDDENALTNPIVLVEVLSEGTERSDRGAKFAHYQRLESLQDYVLISQDSRRVEVFSRGDAGTWVLKTSVGGEHVRLQSIEVSFSVDELYADPTRPAA